MNRRIIYHAKEPCLTVKCEHCGEQTSIFDESEAPIFTVGFEFDKENGRLYIAWSKPLTGENYVKSFGNKVVNERLDKMIADYPEKSYGKQIPKVVSRYINYYIRKAGRYFKEMNDVENIEFWV